MYPLPLCKHDSSSKSLQQRDSVPDYLKRERREKKQEQGNKKRMEMSSASACDRAPDEVISSLLAKAKKET